MLALTTPALLFPAISLLLLAYTNRFLTIATLIRGLHTEYKKNGDQLALVQIKQLRRRVVIIRNMQALGIVSFLSCVITMFLLFFELKEIAYYVFAASLLFLLLSLSLSWWEIQISVNALNTQLGDLEEQCQE